MTCARLVINGCSYMENYVLGNGHKDLASNLNIKHTQSLSMAGSCNSRILRTTLRDSYQTTEPTLYVIGLTMLHRYELPISQQSNTDGRWTSITGNMFSKEYFPENIDKNINITDLNRYSKFWNLVFYQKDALEDLMYRLLCLIDSLMLRNHRVVVFNTAENSVSYYIDNHCFALLREKKQIIQGLSWCSIPWQFQQGAAWPAEDKNIEPNCRHVAPGQHQWLNEFLIDYINQHDILK